MSDDKRVLTLLGSAGGVARAILSLLNTAAATPHDPLYKLLTTCELYLIDSKQKDQAYYQAVCPNLFKKITLVELDLKNTTLFSEHLKTTNTNVVIDVSWADTIDMIRCCNEQGVHYVNTALENTMVDEHEEEFAGFPLMERLTIFEKHKDEFMNMRGIIGSGMNPGVVQWMALHLLKENKNEIPLGCYIVEHDTSFFKDPSNAQPDTIYTTWSPECFLDEAIMSYPMFMKDRTPLFLYEDVYDVEFKVTLGDKIFHGCLMPHEEVYTLCNLYNMEGGFLYKVNAHTTNIIRENLDNVDRVWDLDMQVLDPAKTPLIGEDLIGVLFVYKDKEVYMYNSLSNKEIYDTYKTNATYFQVACGVYASLASLLLDDIPNKLYYVDELLLQTDSQYEKYLKCYMKDFVMGENDVSEGLLLDRMRRFKS